MPPPSATPGRGAIDADREPRGGDGGGGDQRKHRELKVVGDPDAGIVGQHGDEVRRPDAATRREACGQDPADAGAARRDPGLVEQIDGDQARQEADERRHDDQAPVMLGGEAVQDSVHGHFIGLECTAAGGDYPAARRDGSRFQFDRAGGRAGATRTYMRPVVRRLMKD